MVNIWLCNCNKNRKKRNEGKNLVDFCDYFTKQKFSNSSNHSGLLIWKNCYGGSVIVICLTDMKTRAKIFLNYITLTCMHEDGNLMLSTLQNQLFTLHQLDGREENIADGQWLAFKRIMKGSNVTKKKKRVKKFRRPFVYLS